MTDTAPQRPGRSPENPTSVRLLSHNLTEYINRLGSMWIEGQLSEVNVRGTFAYISVRDVDGDESISAALAASALAGAQPAIGQGSRILMQATPEWRGKYGRLQFKVHQIRAVGVGELMARLEALRDLLAAEGLFAQERKKPLPFLPRRIGLICGRNSDAMHDVMKNAARRWPDVEFVVREVAVQGAQCARGVIDALTELDAIDDVDVIVITRGGGSFEDLLGFSDETLVRAVAKAVTPVVAAIGHEEDKPLIDYVADFRASTPTHAASAIVPDVLHEIAAIRNARTFVRQIVRQRLEREEAAIARLRARPALANPAALIDERFAWVIQARSVTRRIVESAVDVRAAQLSGARSTLRALSPQGTLDRGYAIVRDSAGSVVKSVTTAQTGAALTIRVSDGEFEANAR